MTNRKKVIDDFIKKTEQYANLIQQLYGLELGAEIDVEFKKKHIIIRRVK